MEEMFQCLAFLYTEHPTSWKEIKYSDALRASSVESIQRWWYSSGRKTAV